ncbi:hypothetical protein GQX74_015576 [Glossina fuscipes]|nr:hypothetical protein GQX74_015576 [Glossina fuscipes]
MLQSSVWAGNFAKPGFTSFDCERPYKCHLPDCGRAFIQLSNLQQHLRNHDAQVERAKNRPFHCNICGKGFATESSLRTHTSKELQLHLGVLQQHAALIGGPNATSCPICHKLFLGTDALMEHMKHVHKEKPNQNTNSSFIDNIGSGVVTCVSNGVNVGTCAGSAAADTGVCLQSSGPSSVCSDPYSTKRRTANNPCPVCGKHYVNEGSLRKHLACHAETSQLTNSLRMWPCSVCQAVFTHENGLLTHMEHMRMDPKHQFAAQYVLSRAAAERRERGSLLAVTLAASAGTGAAGTSGFMPLLSGEIGSHRVINVGGDGDGGGDISNSLHAPAQHHPHHSSQPHHHTHNLNNHSYNNVSVSIEGELHDVANRMSLMAAASAAAAAVAASTSTNALPRTHNRANYSSSILPAPLPAALGNTNTHQSHHHFAHQTLNTPNHHLQHHLESTHTPQTTTQHSPQTSIHMQQQAEAMLRSHTEVAFRLAAGVAVSSSNNQNSGPIGNNNNNCSTNLGQLSNNNNNDDDMNGKVETSPRILTSTNASAATGCSDISASNRDPTLQAPKIESIAPASDISGTVRLQEHRIEQALRLRSDARTFNFLSGNRQQTAAINSNTSKPQQQN